MPGVQPGVAERKASALPTAPAPDTPSLPRASENPVHVSLSCLILQLSSSSLPAKATILKHPKPSPGPLTQPWALSALGASDSSGC